MLVKGFGLVFLVGVVPSMLLPLIGNGDVGMVLDRLPWLVGVCGGGVLAVILGCWTTAWLAAAAAWGGRPREIIAAIGRFAAGGCRRVAADTLAAARPANLVAPAWVAVLGWFFLVHAAVTLLLPEAVTAGWIEWPEQTLVKPRREAGTQPEGLWGNFPWLPAMVLAANLCAAALLAAAFAHCGAEACEAADRGLAVSGSVGCCR